MRTRLISGAGMAGVEVAAADHGLDRGGVETPERPDGDPGSASERSDWWRRPAGWGSR